MRNSREVAFLKGVTGSCRRGLHWRHVFLCDLCGFGENLFFGFTKSKFFFGYYLGFALKFDFKEFCLKNKYAWVTTIISLIILTDQATKYLVEKHIRLYDTITVIPGFFNLTHVRNRGAAFGVLSGLPGIWRLFFFISVTIVAIGVIAAMIRTAKAPLHIIAFSMITGGAVGNLIDRVRYHEVVDFIQWYVKSYYWPSFNIADSAISVGVCLLVIDMVFEKKTVP
jgi:signal peptidase II